MNDVYMKDYYIEKDSDRDTSKDNAKIRVIVRKRPLNKKETIKNEADIIDIRASNSLVVKELK
jgi:kinesin family protein 2/24